MASEKMQAWLDRQPKKPAEQVKREKAKKAEKTAAWVKARTPEHKPGTPSGKPGTTITVRGGKKDTPKVSKPKVSKPKVAAKPKKNPDADWARKEREGIKTQRTAAGIRSGLATARKMDKKSKPRKLAQAVKPSKGGYASYKSFMGS